MTSYIINYILTHPELSFRAVARQLGVSDRTVRRHWAQSGGASTQELVPSDEAVQILPARIPVDYMERIKVGLAEPPLHLFVDSRSVPVGICADQHVPLFSPEWVNRMVDRHEALGVKTLLSLGDLLNMDALSNYYPKQTDAGYEVERKTARALMGFLLRQYESIYIIRGNHDYRIIKRSNYRLSFVQAMDAYFEGVPGIERATFSNLDHILVTDLSAPGDMSPDWFMAHATAYSSNPLTNARKLADIHKMNVITAHSHHAAIGYAQNGVHVVAEIGGLFDRDRTQYLQSASTFAHWVNGFGTLIDGRLSLTTPGWQT